MQFAHLKFAHLRWVLQETVVVRLAVRKKIWKQVGAQLSVISGFTMNLLNIYLEHFFLFTFIVDQNWSDIILA